jgi:hypothetical protein
MVRDLILLGLQYLHCLQLLSRYSYGFLLFLFIYCVSEGEELTTRTEILAVLYLTDITQMFYIIVVFVNYYL